MKNKIPLIYAVVLSGLFALPLRAAEVSTQPSLPIGCAGHALVSAPGLLYNIGGMDTADGFTASVYYAPITSPGQVGSWSRTSALPEAVFYHSAAYSNGVIYVVGGYHYTPGPGISQSNAVYHARVNADGALGSWNASASLPKTLYLHSTVVWQGSLYVLGGWTGGSGIVSEVFKAAINGDGSLGEWAPSASLPEGLYSQAAAEDGALYVLGGMTQNDEVTDGTYYSLVNENGGLVGWQPAAPMNVPVSNHISAAAAGRVLAVGGWMGAASTSTVQSAAINSDHTLGDWSSLASLPVSLSYHAGAVADNVLYVTGGQDDWGGLLNGVYSVSLQQSMTARVDVDPDRWNLLGNRRFVAARFSFVAGVASAADIDPESIRLVAVNGAAIAAIAPSSSELGRKVLTAKFDRSLMDVVLKPGDNKLDFQGRLKDRRDFTASGAIWAKQPHRRSARRIGSRKNPEAKPLKQARTKKGRSK